jgi:hypothetical protein
MDSGPDALPVADDIQLSLASRMRVHLSWGAFATKSRKFTSRNQRHQEKPVQKGRDHGIPAFFRWDRFAARSAGLSGGVLAVFAYCW